MAEAAVLCILPLCAICQEGLDRGRVCIPPTCGHLFHEECLKTWKEARAKSSNRHYTCPTCRQESSKIIHVALPLDRAGERYENEQLRLLKEKVTCLQETLNQRERELREENLKLKSDLETSESRLGTLERDIAESNARESLLQERVEELNTKIRKNQAKLKLVELRDDITNDAKFTLLVDELETTKASTRREILQALHTDLKVSNQTQINMKYQLNEMKSMLDQCTAEMLSMRQQLKQEDLSAKKRRRCARESFGQENEMALLLEENLSQSSNTQRDLQRKNVSQPSQSSKPSRSRIKIKGIY